MFLLRDVQTDDLDGLLAVARHLDTVNLPNDRAVLDKLIDRSMRSFSGELPPFEREYLFVLLDQEQHKIVGTSMIHAQHGTRRAPHIFFDLLDDERYSETLDRHFVHKVLRIGYNYNGPTEIGGLVVLPEYRRHKHALGRWLSYVRFLYIATHRAHFRDEVLSELLPPLRADGSSVMWESIGRRFTGMSYQEADRISQTNKEFIRTLFPADPIYLSLFPDNVQQEIGQVGPGSKGVEKMLTKVGFRFVDRIDPFDGGPHFVARTDEITLVKGTRRLRVVDGVAPTEGALHIVSAERNAHFGATGTLVHISGDDVVLPDGVRRLLGVDAGDPVHAAALDADPPKKEAR